MNESKSELMDPCHVLDKEKDEFKKLVLETRRILNVGNCVNAFSIFRFNYDNYDSSD